MDIIIPAPRQELTAQQLRELLPTASSTGDLHRRLSAVRDAASETGADDRRSA